MCGVFVVVDFVAGVESAVLIEISAKCYVSGGGYVC